MPGHNMKYEMTSPCATCPFRRNNVGFLTEKGAQRIADDLLNNRPFSCHHMDRTPDVVEPQHCAGALIVLEKMRRPHLAMILGASLGLYDRTKLEIGHPYVFHNMKQFIYHHAHHLPGVQGVKGNNGPNLDVIQTKAEKRAQKILVEMDELPDEPQWRPVGGK
jgi:hypothetical protein